MRSTSLQRMVPQFRGARINEVRYSVVNFTNERYTVTPCKGCQLTRTLRSLCLLLECCFPYGLHCPFSRASLRPATSFTLDGNHSALRQNHASNAGVLLRGEPLQLGAFDLG